MKKVELNFKENEIVIARFAEQTKAISKKTNRLPRLDCVKSRNDKKINVCKEASCDGFVGFQVRKRENMAYSPLSESARRIPQIRARGNRAGFGMMFAIIITILVATLGVLAVRFSTQTLNTTTNEYIAIQLDLYLNSTAELAILYVQRNGFVCLENESIANCDVGEVGNANKRADVTAPIEKYINYGKNKEYRFKYMITPLANYDGYNPNVYTQLDQSTGVCEPQNNKPCFKEEMKNAFILDISGSVTNPLTHQTLRVNKRQVIKP